MPQTAPVGILLVDKDPGITSHDAVARVRRALGTRKVGHAGTLDPMATGLLVMGVGAATKLLTFFVGLDKEYAATIRLGRTTTTDDADGELLEPADADADAVTAATDARILDGIRALTGDILQQPSAVSAIKVDGRRAYDRVRSGEEVELPARPVTISAFEVLEIRRGTDADAAPVIDVDVRVECSSGTYIRALARDLGAGLGVGGHLTALRRTRVGGFAVSDALAVASRDRDAPVDDAVSARLIAPAEAAAARFPVVTVDTAAARDLADGKRIPLPGDEGDEVAVVEHGGRLVGIARVQDGRSRVIMNLPTEPASASPSAPQEKEPTA